jgi:hypothetical protein
MAGAENRLLPGWPGRGLDPTEHFTDMQWYFYHQRAVAYFGAFSNEAYDGDRLALFTRDLLTAAPAFNSIGGNTLPNDVLHRLASIETVSNFEGFPDCWNDEEARIMDDPELPMVRIRVAQLADGPDAQDRRSFVLVQVAHALTEGNDSSHLSRSQAASHEQPVEAPPVPLRWALPARILAFFHVLGHLVLGRLWTPHKGRVRLASRTYPREVIKDIAHGLGVSQRGLMLALVARVIANGGTPSAPRRISTAHTTLASGGGANRDRFMRMRIIYGALENRPDLRSFVRSVDADLKRHEANETGFESELKAATLGGLRRVSRIAPFLYSPKLFAFWPYGIIFSLLTPHQIAGDLTKGMLEPVYCGTSIRGLNGCIVVPGTNWVTFNFFLEERMLPWVSRLDAAIEELGASANATTPAAVSEKRSPPAAATPRAGSEQA